jgi:peptidoglycan/LPS O-acetylase OafA/YrhL
MWVLILLILLIGAVTGTLGGILEVAAGVVLGLLLFVVGIALALYYVVRYRFRKALREWERGAGAGPPHGPRRPRGELPPEAL